LIQHVVVIFQENRTPDNLFHGLPNADIADFGVDSKGKNIRLTPVKLASNYDLDHDNEAYVKMYDGGKMNGADKIKVRCKKGVRGCPPHPQFKYVRRSDVLPYFQLAETYTFGDRMFQTNQGPSFPAHQFIISGTSAPTATSDLFAAENPSGVPHATEQTGCTAPREEFVKLIDPQGKESHKMHPCFEHLTLPDLLDNAGISWRYYAPGAGSIWTGPNAISHLRFGPDWSKDVILDHKQVLRDIAQGQLADVSWVIPSGRQSDHAAINDGSGPSWVASVVNAVGGSQYWTNTAIFITWDDWGGWFDHVAHAILKNTQKYQAQYSYQLGFRVPLIVVSAYSPQTGYINNETSDFGSVLRAIEGIFNLPGGEGALNFADARAKSDLSSFFNFNQSPTIYTTIPAPLQADYFVSFPSPPEPQDND
jgi:phospholipase C